MPRFEDYRSDPEVRDIVERYVKKFPRVFDGFKVEDIFYIVTQKKKLRGKHPIKVKPVPYPHYVSSGKTYVFETFETSWEKMTPKRKNPSVFHSMCSIPLGGFDTASVKYGKLLKPDFNLYRSEYAASGGVADWFEDDSARDPMEIDASEVPVVEEEGNENPLPENDNPIPSKSTKSPVTAKDLTLEDEPEDKPDGKPEAVAS